MTNLRPLPLLTSLVLAASTQGCAAKVVLPPTSTAALLEAPATLGAGKQAVEGATAATGALFGPSLDAVGVRYTRGVSGSVDVGITPTVQVVRGGKGAVDGYRAGDGVAYGADAHVKVNPFDSKHVAIFGSLGGAYGRYASFVSGSAGIALGYDNAYVVPFVDLVVYGSAPLATEAFTYRSEPSATPKTLEASTTFGGLASAGLAVKATESVTLKASVHHGRARSETDTLTVVGGAAALGITF